MPWRWPCDKPLSEPMVVSLLTHICITRPQWVKTMVSPCPISRPLSKPTQIHYQLNSIEGYLRQVCPKPGCQKMIIKAPHYWPFVREMYRWLMNFPHKGPVLVTVTSQWVWWRLKFECRSKNTSKLHITGLCAGNSPVTGEFPTQIASVMENVSIWWCHHVLKSFPWDDVIMAT